jgi:C1A family cysteine protease
LSIDLDHLRRRLGARRDRPDPNDTAYTPPPTMDGEERPSSVDLRGQFPPVYDQGRIASCTANALAAAIVFCRGKHAQLPAFEPSRLFIYYNERALAGDIANDAGASMRDGITTLAKQGVAPESLWTYDDTPATTPGGPFPAGAKPAQQPPAAAYDLAVLFETLSSQRLRNNLDDMKACLAEGYPFTLGIVVYPSFMSAPQQQATVTPLPGPDEQPLGEHVVLAVGYDDAKAWMICRNSWGPAQGEDGYFYLPYAYIENRHRIGDLWSVRTVEH